MRAGVVDLEGAGMPIAARKNRALAQQPAKGAEPAKEETQGKRHEVLGLVTLATAAMGGLALASYDARGGRDWCGPIGAGVAESAVAFIGTASVLIPWALLITSVRLFRRTVRPVRPLRALGTVAIIAAIATALHLSFGERPLLGHLAAGGLVGITVGEGMRALIGTAGAHLVTLTVLLVALVVRTRLSIVVLASRARAVSVETGSKARDGVVTVARAWKQAREEDQRSRTAEERDEAPRIVAAEDRTADALAEVFASSHGGDDEGEDEEGAADAERTAADEVLPALAPNASSRGGGGGFALDPTARATESSPEEARAGAAALLAGGGEDSHSEVAIPLVNPARKPAPVRAPRSRAPEASPLAPTSAPVRAVSPVEVRRSVAPAVLPLVASAAPVEAALPVAPSVVAPASAPMVVVPPAVRTAVPAGGVAPVVEPVLAATAVAVAHEPASVAPAPRRRARRVTRATSAVATAQEQGIEPTKPAAIEAVEDQVSWEDVAEALRADEAIAPAPAADDDELEEDFAAKVVEAPAPKPAARVRASEPVRREPVRSEPARVEAPRVEAPRVEPVRSIPVAAPAPSRPSPVAPPVLADDADDEADDDAIDEVVAAPVASRPAAKHEAHDDEEEQDASDDEEEESAVASIVEPVRAAPARVAPSAPVRLARPMELPSTVILTPPSGSGVQFDEAQLRNAADRLVKTLKDYSIDGRVVEIHPGPVVTTFEFVPAAGTKLSKIARLGDDIAMSLEASRVRIVAPIPGKGRVGFEIPNLKRQTVSFRELLETEAWANASGALPVALGKDVVGTPFVTDLAKMPHLIVAGATGAGKSVGLNVMLTSLLFKRGPEDVRLLMIDPKMVELAVYDGIPHMLLPVVTDMKKAALALRWVVDEMERRYTLFAQTGSRNITSYNERVLKAIAEGTTLKGANGPVRPKSTGTTVEVGPDGENAPGGEGAPAKLPYILVVVDEFADLMMVAGKEVEAAVARLAQKARAAGIHVILATQRPSVDVITGVIKANFPSRVAFKVSQKVDSRTILDQQGAEHLLGMGDMLILPPGSSDLRRVHCAFASEEEVQVTTDHWRAQGTPTYDEDILKPREEEEAAADEPEIKVPADKYEKAVALVLSSRRCSVSWIQRQLAIGYNVAARIVEKMERDGIVSPPKGPGKDREVVG